MLPKFDIFVDREDELKTLEKLVTRHLNVLLVGLRGYGKTSLLVKLVEKTKCARSGVYINCLLIYGGKDLIEALRDELLRLELEGCIQFDKDKFDLKTSRINSSKDYLNIFYELLAEHKIDFVIFDEISTLFRRLGAQKPFRGFGGARAVAEHFKALLDTYKEISTIFADTSINFHYELFMEYSGPLFRQYHALVDLDPLSLEAATTMVHKLLEKYGIEATQELELYIADTSGGVPTYIEMIIALTKQRITIEELEKRIEESLDRGILNNYFKALIEKFSFTEQEILYAIAKGITRFKDLQKTTNGAPQALESLMKKGIIINIKKGARESYYLIKDKLFAVWLATKEKPGMKKLTYKKARILSAGFESLIREAIFTLKERIRLIDELQQEIVLDPPKKVYRYEGALGEIDLIAEYENNEVIVGEIYIGQKCRKEKIDQLIKNIGIAERLGYKIRLGILISYFEVPTQIIEYVKKQETTIPISIITRKQLKQISKASAIRIPYTKIGIPRHTIRS